MEEGYFVPKLEDFHIGYEYEVWGHSYIKGFIWIPQVIESSYDFNNVWDIYNEGKSSTNIRVSYLTKEQIENEGWKPGKLGGFEKDNADGTIYYTLKMNDHHNILITKSQIEGWTWIWSPFYSGECKDINTLRYILKLLNI